MLKEKLCVFLRASLIADLFATLLSFILAFYLRGVLPFPAEKVWEFGMIGWLLLIIIPVWCILLASEHAYDVLGKRSVYLGSFKAIIEGMAILLGILFLTRAYFYSRLFIMIFGVVNTIFILSLRRIGIWLLGEQSVFVIGGGERVELFYNFLTHHSPLKFKLVNAASEEYRPARRTGSLAGEKDMWATGKEDLLNELESVVSNNKVDWVVSVINEPNFNFELIESCTKIGIPVSWAMPANNARVGVESYGGISFFTFSTAPETSLMLLFKYTMDRIFALLLLILNLPLFCWIAILIKLSSKGNIFFTQERIGLNGRRFKLFKFRTMIQEAESMQSGLAGLNIMSGAAFKVVGDPRITNIGKLLRQTSLDELPQLINVLRGEMSLIGPRPPLPAEVNSYEPWQRRKLSMKPGLTCIWQVSGRNEVDFAKWMIMDLEYIDNWGLWFDFKLLLRTLPAIVFAKGAY